MDKQLFSISQIRFLEKAAIEKYCLSEFNLMERAGKASFDNLLTYLPHCKKLLIFCGPGNNGGDGYVLAKIAHEAGYEVGIRYIGDQLRFSKSTQLAFNACEASNIGIQAFNPQELLTADVIIDALLGIGLKNKVSTIFAQAINYINTSGKPVMSIDVPSGIDANTGAKLGVAIRAQVTVTFIGLKQGLFTNDAVDHCGTIVLDNLGLSKEIYHEVAATVELLDETFITQHLLPRNKNVNKRDFGHVLIIGGDKGMAGAARLAAEASLRVGAGLVTVATRPEHITLIPAHYPEIMCHGIQDISELKSLINKASVLVIGPGLGQNDWGKEIFSASLNNALPKIIDADGLNLLGKKPTCEENWLLTPHPGEAARLLGYDLPIEVQANRFDAINQLVALGGNWILKGAGSLVKSRHTPIYLCPFGNPGMASAGMGDVLSGILGGLLAQQPNVMEAAILGVLLHALAGDKAAQKGGRGIIASDLIENLNYFVNPGLRS